MKDTPEDELFGADSTKGRAVVTQFDGHTINYSNSGLLIEALGRTIVARIGPISKSGNTGDETKMPLARDADFAQNSVSWARLGVDASDQYHSYLGYVSEITDPEGRTTSFEYEPYTKIYTGSGFPVSNASAHITLNNWRLKEVHEPTADYVLDYYSWDPIHPDPTPSDTAVIYSTTKDLYKLQYPLKEYRKYEAGTLLTTDRYVYEMSGIDDKYFSKSTHTLIDDVAADSMTTTTWYRRSWMPSFLPYLPPVVHTEMYRVDQNAAGYSSSRVSHDDSLALLVRLPDTISQSVNGVNRSTQIDSYTLERVRHFGGDSTLAQWFGSEVATRTESFTCDCPDCEINDVDSTTYRRVETHYLNLPFIDSTATYVDTLRLDKFATLERFRQLKADGTIDGEWEEMMYDPQVFVGVHDTLQLRVPPWYGLVSQTTEADLVRWINRTKFNIYQTAYTGDYFGAPRGFLLRDSSAGGTINGTQKGMPGSRRVYVRSRGHLLLDSTIDANGAVARSFYKYRYASDTLGHADAALEPYALKGREIDMFGTVDTVDLDLREDLTYLLEQPSVNRTWVRTADPSAPGGIGLRAIDRYQELTYYGLARRVVDPNGWCSQFDYDADGRLVTAWLPRDFPRLDSFYIIQESGTEEFDVVGTSLMKWAYDTLYCDQNCQPSGYASAPGVWTNYEERLLYADNPTIPQYDCYGEIVSSTDGGKGGAVPLRSCSAPLPYVHPAPTGLTLYLWVNKIDTLSAVSIDSAWIRLYLGAVSDTCLNVEFSRDDWSFSQTYSLNCPLPPPNSNRSLGKSGASTLSGGDGVYLDDQGREYLLVDLTSQIGKLLDSAAAGAPFVTVDVNVTTEGGYVSFLSGVEGVDVRPRLVLKGTFERKHRFEDYTLKYEHDDAALRSTVLAKIDDSLHSANVIDWATYNTNRRVTKGVYRFGADYRVKSALTYIDDPDTPTRIDSVVTDYSGNGRRRRVQDQVGDSVVTHYDALGRPVETINGDRTHTTVSYLYGRQEAFGIDREDQRFPCAYVAATVSLREDSVKFVRYEDAFGNVRREVADSGGLTLTTRYDYDYLGQLRQVVNPAGDTTRYWYDEFGRVRYKHQPDLGYISYAYDNVGNVRFTQTEAQADSGRMTFNEYDDLNRLVLVGEMIDQAHAGTDSVIHYGIAPDGGVTGAPRSAGASDAAALVSAKAGARTLTDGDELGLNRLTDLAEPRLLNTGGASSILTANPTMWMTPIFSVPKVRSDSAAWVAVCQMGPNVLLGDTSTPRPPYLATPVGITRFYDPRKGPGATLYDFEHLAQYPHFPRMAISYDTLPLRQGPIWENFPSYRKWDSIAPKGRIRNTVGHEVAVAYREHGGEPYHYTVLSYDERGRVEALLRYTENLGFDAIYYTYNSMNQATAVRVADPFRQYTSWYGYDGNGRVDSVWTKLDDVGSGLLVMLPSRRADSLRRPLEYPRSDSVSDADITYQYTPTGQVSLLRYPGQSVQVQYSYDHRKRLTTIAASHFPTFLGWIFREDLTYDSTGQIVKQRSRSWGSSSWLTQNYLYDPVQRLTGWKASTLADTTFYSYDDVGNRTYEAAGGGNTLSMYTASQTPNRLQTTVRSDPFLPNPVRTDYGYNLNGSVVDRQYYSVSGQGLVSTGEDHFQYSYRELNWRYVSGDPETNEHTDWRYRYNAMGEREGKRMYHHPTGDNVPFNAYPWVYYVLGGSKEQLSVWGGEQTSVAGCDSSGRRVYMYPMEYITNGVGYTGVYEDLAQLIVRPSGAKEYRISDHLGSLRAVVSTAGSIDTFAYDPWGEVLNGGTVPRRGFNDNEEDRESDLYSLGVRKYNRDRFLSVDPLWEKDASWSPYVYSGDNPLRYVDPAGQQRRVVDWPPSGYQGMRGSPPGGSIVVSNPLSQALTSQQWEDILSDAVITAVYTGLSINQVLDEKFNGLIHKTLDEVLGEATEGKKSSSKQYIKEGTIDDANGDFDGLVEPGTVSDKGQGIRVGELPDGRTIIVRPKSSEGSPTLEIEGQKGVSKPIKIRYHAP